MLRTIILLWLFASLTACGGLVAEARSTIDEQGVSTPASATAISRPPQEGTIMPVDPTPTPDDKARQRLRPARPSARPRIQAPRMPPGTSLKAPLNPVVEALVQAGQNDLAGRAGVAADTIARIEVRSVVWSDGSLGCPREGVAYPQVQVEGLFVRFRVGGRDFDYHSGNGRPLFLCDQRPPSGKPAPPSGDSQ